MFRLCLPASVDLVVETHARLAATMSGTTVDVHNGARRPIARLASSSDSSRDFCLCWPSIT